MSPEQDDILTAQPGEEQDGGQSMADHHIALTAKMDGTNKIKIEGDRSKKTLGKGGGPGKFKFALEDQTKHKVRFASLRAADESSTCPPPTGKPNTQIERTDDGSDPLSAEFKDKNDNKPEMDVSYEWTFTCDDPNIKIETFDPIISNGGRV